MRAQRQLRRPDESMARSASAEALPVRAPRVPRVVVRTEHTLGEERLAYAVFLFIVAGIVMACVGLSLIDWKVEDGSADAFGVVRIHLADSGTHHLETMGLVWSVYTASRCALGFTLIGVIISLWVLTKIKAFARDNIGTIASVLRLSFACSFFYLWAIMLYACLFPSHPFKGDLFLLTLGSNFTSWDATPSTRWETQQTISTPIRPLADGDPLVNPADDAFRIALADEFKAHRQSLRTATLSAHTATSFASDPVFPDAFGVPSATAPSIPRFSRSRTTDPNADTAELQKQYAYSLVAWDHLDSVWTLSTGYWLVMSSALVTLWWPVVYIVYILTSWLYEKHIASEVQQKFLIGPIALLACAWLLALIGFASRYWKEGDSTHFGLDKVIVSGSRRAIATYRFSEKTQRIQQASATALAFGILGILSGFATWAVTILHVYDSSREWTLAIALSAVTSALWLIAMISYGCAFPYYIASEYFAFGYSFWLVVAASCIYFLPTFAFILWRIQLRAKKTTAEERRMAIPVSLALFAVLFTIAALGSTTWTQSTVDTPGNGRHGQNHLGLVMGRYNGTWVHFHEIGLVSTRLSSAGMSALVLLVCAVLIQAPTAILGFVFVSGRHEHLCLKQLPLLSTALNAAAFLLQVIAVVAYAELIPFGEMVDGYTLSHAWRGQIVACVCSLGSVIGFGLLSHPPLPGEPNLLAEAIR